MSSAGSTIFLIFLLSNALCVDLERARRLKILITDPEVPKGGLATGKFNPRVLVNLIRNVADNVTSVVFSTVRYIKNAFGLKHKVRRHTENYIELTEIQMLEILEKMSE